MNNGAKGYENTAGYLKLNRVKAKVVDNIPTNGILDGAFEFGIKRK